MRRGEEHQILRDLETQVAGSLSSWEQEFIASLSDRLEHGEPLTDRQRKKLVEIYEEKVLGY